ncbi:MAG: twin-arginine translocation signal domain-containing protein, partial [Opitutae bacterium]|nr:twin-arginine translocation signal domain-containing protein [Opitutae bacterium]
MATHEQLSPIGHSLLSRRNFLRNTGTALGGFGLAGLLAQDGLLGSEDPANFSGKTPIRPVINPDNPYSPRASHHNPPAKQVLVIYCPGAV